MILIDSSSLCHAAKHSMKDLSWEDKKVGVIFGFLLQLLSLAKLFKSNQFVFIWDSRQSLREEIFPAYKYKRKHKVKTEEEKENDEVAYTQFGIIRKEILPSLGFNNSFKCEGYEADDLIAKVCSKYSKEQIIIISTDEDLYQLLSNNISIYSIRKKQHYTNKNLWKDYRIIPEEWGEVKAIAGCETDEVPGVDNVGNKTAAKYIGRKLSLNSKTYRAIKESKELIERNKKLVVLPFKGTPEIPDLVKDSLRLHDFIKIAQRYGFQSMLNKDNLSQWKQHIFKGA